MADMARAQAEVNFRLAAATSDGVLAAAAEVGRSVEVLQAARDRFLWTGDVLLDEAAEPPFPERFPDEEQYLKFLARVGRDPRRDVLEKHNTTERTVRVLRALRTPGTIAYLKTKVYGKHWGETTLAIGRVVGVSRPRILNSTTTGIKRDLVLQVQTAVTNGDPHESSVNIDDIAEAFNPYRGGPGTSSPIIATAEAGVKSRVKQAYDERRYPMGDTLDAFRALTRSGLYLSELGFTEEEVAARRRTVVNNLGLAVGGHIDYHREALMLPALCETTREALQVVDKALDSRDAAGISDELRRDRMALLDNIEPEQ